MVGPRDIVEYREISARRMKAKRDYTCAYCRGAIPRNTYYVRIVYLFDGSIGYDRTCTGNRLCGHDEYEEDTSR